MRITKAGACSNRRDDFTDVCFFDAGLRWGRSHHTTVAPGPGGGGVLGTDHLVHHQKFIANYGNFRHLDRLAGSYRTTEQTVRSWL